MKTYIIPGFLLALLTVPAQAKDMDERFVAQPVSLLDTPSPKVPTPLEAWAAAYEPSPAFADVQWHWVHSRCALPNSYAIGCNGQKYYVVTRPRVAQPTVVAPAYVAPTIIRCGGGDSQGMQSRSGMEENAMCSDVAANPNVQRLGRKVAGSVFPGVGVCLLYSCEAKEWGFAALFDGNSVRQSGLTGTVMPGPITAGSVVWNILSEAFEPDLTKPQPRR